MLNPLTITKSRILGICAGSALIILSGCRPASSVTIEREVLLSRGLASRGNSINRTPDKGFVIAGNRNGAWAARVDANGKVLWEFADTREEPSITRPIESQFNGSVVLADNSVLLCGSKETQQGGVALLVNVALDGHVRNEQYLTPNGESARFDECARWGDAVVLFGLANSGGRRDDWMIRLDNKGTKLWERIGGEDFLPSDFVETAQGDLVLASRVYEPAQGVELIRVNPDGNFVKTRIVPGSQIFFLVHSVVPTDRGDLKKGAITYAKVGGRPRFPSRAIYSSAA